MRHKVAIDDSLTACAYFDGSRVPKFKLRTAVEAWIRENVEGPFKLSYKRDLVKGSPFFTPYVCFGRKIEAAKFKLVWG